MVLSSPRRARTVLHATIPCFGRPERENWAALIHEQDHSGQNQLWELVGSIWELTGQYGQTGRMKSDLNCQNQAGMLTVFLLNQTHRQKLDILSIQARFEARAHSSVLYISYTSIPLVQKNIGDLVPRSRFGGSRTKNGGGGGEGRGGNGIWQNTIAWARIWPTRQLCMVQVWLVFHVYSTVIELDNALRFAFENAVP